MPQCMSIYSAMVLYAVVGLRRRIGAVDMLYACVCIFVVYYLCGVFLFLFFIFFMGGGGGSF